MKKNQPKSPFIFIVLALCLILTSSGKAQTDTEVKEATAKASILIDQERYAEAVPYLEILVKAAPNDSKLRFLYGFSLVAKSKQSDDNELAKQLAVKALEQFKTAKQLGLNNPMNDALIKILSGEDKSENTQAYSKNPEADKYVNQAESYFAQANYDEAIKLFEKALALDPNIYEAAISGGDSYVAKKDWANAEIWYQKAIAINPNRETAYRYSATPFMRQEKYDEARDRYIEAFITEPYSQMSPRGISQWAGVTGAKLGHPKVDIPEIKYDASGKTIMAAPVDNPNHYSDWKTYITTRIAWHNEKFAKTFPDEKEYRHTLQEEAESIRSVLKTAKEQNLTNSQFEILQKLDTDGLLEAFILMAKADDGIAEDHEAYLKNNRPKLRRYVLNYVIHK